MESLFPPSMNVLFINLLKKHQLSNVWIDSVKDPITDPGKKSKAGRLDVVFVSNRSIVTVSNDKVDGEYISFDQVSLMQDVYYNGQLLNETTLEEVRARAAR